MLSAMKRSKTCITEGVSCTNCPPRPDGSTKAGAFGLEQNLAHRVCDTPNRAPISVQERPASKPSVAQGSRYPSSS